MNTNLLHRLPHDLCNRSGHRHLHRLFSFFVAATFTVPHAWAETEIQFGTGGFHGFNGVNDGSAGGGGGLGEDAMAYAAGLDDAENSATAFGGPGGGGGLGADAGADSAWGGRGGQGGSAGPAQAMANTVRLNGGDATATAEASGGQGGWGGDGGDGYVGGLYPGGGGLGGFGGTASASASATTGEGSVEAKAIAIGGWGGLGGDGGFEDIYQNGLAGSGQLGGGGHASASGSNSSNHPVFVQASASGGGGGSGGSGGLLGGTATRGATASLGTVTGISTGGGNVTVSGEARGGDGGDGGRVNVLYEENYPAGGRGASVSLVNAISGTTTGMLLLKQNATGGSGGTGFDQGGAGALASSILNHTDTAAAGLGAQVSANGGNGGAARRVFLPAEGDPGSGAPATAQLNLSSAGDIDFADVWAVGGRGGDGQFGASGAVAEVLSSSAVSTGIGKTVSLSARQVGGKGGGTIDRAGTIGGNGADSHMLNVVSGAAPGGSLQLEQAAIAGAGGNTTYGSGGNSGDASSSLTFIQSGEQQLEVSVTADASHGGIDYEDYGVSDDGFCTGMWGDATATGTIQDSHDVELRVSAKGGVGGNGGNAANTASAISTGDGTVTVYALSRGGSVTSRGGARLPGTASLTAYGESQGGPVTVSGTAEGGGGLFKNTDLLWNSIDDESVSTLTSHVDGQAASLTNAVNGRSSGVLTLSQTALGGVGTAGQLNCGNGGDAISSINLPGGNPGGGELDARVLADGGDCILYDASQISGMPGSATAVCEVQNAGDVRAGAVASPGVSIIEQGSTFVSPSPANATAKATSTLPFGQAYAIAESYAISASGGSLSATAETFGGIFSKVSATASATSTIFASPRVACKVGERDFTSFYGGPPLLVSALPEAIGVLPTNSEAALLDLTPLAEIYLESRFTNASTTMVMHPTGYSGPLKLALIWGSADSDDGLTSVRFTLTRGGSTLIDQTFTDWSLLVAYFDDQVIDLGPVSLAAGQPLTFNFTLGGSAQGFSAFMLLAAKKSPFSAWANGYGLANLLSDGTDSDKDGESDLLEFAFNSHPLNGSRGSQMPLEILADRLRIQFIRRRGDTQGLSYLLETSSTLSGVTAWAPMAPPWTVITDDLSDTLESVTCEVPREEVSGTLFIRMKVMAE